MANVVATGDSPAGLTTTLSAVKNGPPMTVSDTDQTWMHKAHLFNYPEISSIDGSNYMETLHTQVGHFDMERHQDEGVTDASKNGDGFIAATDNDECEVDYVVLAMGANRDLAESLGCASNDDLVDVDVTIETGVEDAYAMGVMVRAEEWQATIPAGDGAVTALNILSKEKGEHYRDSDVPTDVESVFGSFIDKI